MVDSVFDFRDDEFRNDARFQAPANAPSATAGALRDTTRKALANPGTTRIREPNIIPSPFGAGGDKRPAPAPQTPDRSGPNISFITPDGRSPGDPLKVSQERTASLFERARGTNNLADRSSLLREALASAKFDNSALDSRTSLENTGTRAQSAADIANVRSRLETNLGNQRTKSALQLGQLDSTDRRAEAGERSATSRANAALSATTSRANNADTLTARALADKAALDQRQQQFDARQSQGSYTISDHFTQLLTPGSPQELQSLKAAHANARNDGERKVIEQMIAAAGAASRGEVPGGFEGGLVTATGFADGGIVEGGGGPALGPASPQLPDPDLINKYTQYAEGAKAMGLTTIGFDQFAQMSQGAAATAGTAPAPSGAGAPVALAEGGEVPGGNGGRMVIDSDPNAPTDSIPAVIDGQQPAKLDSGELVFPRHAVLYYGTDKLNKMIAKSKEAEEGGNGDSATGLNS